MPIPANALASEHVERSILDLLVLELFTTPPAADKVRVYRPGEALNKPTPQEYVIARPMQILRLGTSQGGQKEETWIVEIRCFVRANRRGRKFGDLSRLADKVRAVVDGEYGAVRLTLTDIVATTIGHLDWEAADEERLYGVDQQAIDRETVFNVDISRVRATALVRSCL